MEKNQLSNIMKLLRPTHYIKNLFVLLPLFFSAQITNSVLLFNALLAFVSFCLVASSVYVFNDIYDADEDRFHPQKKTRPIASGAISIPFAFALDICLSFCGLFLAFLVNYQLLLVLVAYKLINILYTLILKRIAILDVMVLSLGFVLRLYAGSVSTDVKLSEWIIIMTFLLSMLIVVGKRRNDVSFFEKEEIVLRHAVKGYNSMFLNYTMILLSSVIIVAYIMYTVSPEIRLRLGTDHLFTTVFWVVAGILRYLQLLFVFSSKDNPVRLLIKDHPLKLILLAWFLNFLYFLYMA
jgi:decaprenyl-phosphate phosphoribosyltransferase